jgi:small subunit ribosomal protein S11
MGKKRTADTTAPAENQEASAAKAKGGRRRVEAGVLYVQATFNNTKVLLTDTRGNAIMQSSSGALGFTGAKKGTPFAAAKVGEVLSEKAEALGLKAIDVVVKGIGAGRESAIRSFTSRGVQIKSIQDMTAVPFNGPTKRKPRRV